MINRDRSLALSRRRERGKIVASTRLAASADGNYPEIAVPQQDKAQAG